MAGLRLPTVSAQHIADAMHDYLLTRASAGETWARDAAQIVAGIGDEDLRDLLLDMLATFGAAGDVRELSLAVASASAPGSPKPTPRNLHDMHWPALRRLDLSGCHVADALYNVFDRTPLLSELILVDCDLTVLPESVGLLRNLRVLKLSRNALDDLPAALHCCTALRELYVDDNRFRIIPGFVKLLPHLTMLRRLGDIDSPAYRAAIVDGLTHTIHTEDTYHTRSAEPPPRESLVNRCLAQVLRTRGSQLLVSDDLPRPLLHEVLCFTRTAHVCQSCGQFFAEPGIMFARTEATFLGCSMVPFLIYTCSPKCHRAVRPH